ncbi:MAG: DNA repair protein RecO [Pseudomonadota bacterium]
MNFKDRGIILSKSPLKEKSSIVTIFTENHGIYSGVLKQYNKKSGDNLVEGNLVDFFWTARLHEHLGSAKAELVKSYNAYLMTNKTKLYAFNSIVSILKASFCEREPHNNLFPQLILFMEKLKESFAFDEYIKFELEILKESGYQLQLNSCAATGISEDLIYVSPKSGQAVSRNAGMPYASKLLTLPQFLINSEAIDLNSINDAFKLTSYFFERYILADKPNPPARTYFIELMQSMS